MLTAREIFKRLSDWSHRGACSEQEAEARESLMAVLTGEYGVHITEEGFHCPRNYLQFFWMLAILQSMIVLASGIMPIIMLLAGIFVLICHVRYFDWRTSPLIWWGARDITANVSASKGSGDRLVILMAHLDSAPSSFAYRPDQVRHFKLAIYVGTGIMGFGVILPAMAAEGIDLPLWVRGGAVFFLMVQALIASLDFWRFGYTPGANDNLTGVAAAVEVASRLWAKTPTNTEVRLVITSGEEAGMLGAQHYWQQHREELKWRDTHVLNFDTVGAGRLAFVTESGGFTPVFYDGVLARTASAVTKLDKRYAGIGPARHHVGDFDSVWFARDGISALTIAAYDDDGMMPHIHTPEDRPEHVSLKIVEDAAAFGEAIIRMLPRLKT